MNRIVLVACAVVLVGSCMGQDVPAGDISTVARDINSKIASVTAFSARLETQEIAEGQAGDKNEADLLVSRQHGWKLSSDSGPDAFTFVTDFKTFYQYFPADKRVIKVTADTPEMQSMIRKPVTDMNPLNLLSSSSLKYLGQEQVEGQTVYRVSGTTESQLMPGGPKVQRTLTAWIGVEDGLPRKTVESVGVSTGTTIYKSVKVNPAVTPADFAFTPPEGVSVIDPSQMQPGKQPTPPASPKP